MEAACTFRMWATLCQDPKSKIKIKCMTYKIKSLSDHCMFAVYDLRVIVFSSQEQDQKTAAIHGSERYLCLGRYCSLDLYREKLHGVHIQWSRSRRTVYNSGPTEGLSVNLWKSWLEMGIIKYSCWILKRDFSSTENQQSWFAVCIPLALKRTRLHIWQIQDQRPRESAWGTDEMKPSVFDSCSPIRPLASIHLWRDSSLMSSPAQQQDVSMKTGYNKHTPLPWFLEDITYFGF
jgi:hypothetical protein